MSLDTLNIAFDHHQAKGILHPLAALNEKTKKTEGGEGGKERIHQLAPNC